MQVSMRRGVLLLLPSLALVACGSRTGLEVELIEGGTELDASDAQTDGDAELDGDAQPDVVDARPDVVPLGLCPLSPPTPNEACPPMTKSVPILCAYVPTVDTVGLMAVWCCAPGGGWVNCRTQANTMETCSQIVCSPGVINECVVGGGTQCCTCSADGTGDECGPC
jgi:hypothetical protein